MASQNKASKKAPYGAAQKRQGRPGNKNQGRPRQKPRQASGNRLDTSCYIEGRRAVQEAMDNNVALVRVLVADQKGKRDTKFLHMVEHLKSEGVRIDYVDNTALDELSVRGAHQGIIAQTKPYQYADVEELIARGKDKDDALIVLLDHVTDDGNFGAIARSCEVVGAEGVIIPNARSAKVSMGSYSTSVGAVFRMPIAQVSNLATTIDRLKEAGYWVFGSTEHADQCVWDAPMHGKCVLVMGSEGDGISKLVQQKCDFLVKLPQAGRIESLNVAQAATVMCFEWLRQSTMSKAGQGE